MGSDGATQAWESAKGEVYDTIVGKIQEECDLDSSRPSVNPPPPCLTAGWGIFFWRRVPTPTEKST